MTAHSCEAASVGGGRHVEFASGSTWCAASHYQGTTGACIVMAGGLGVPRGPATERYARRFHDAGFTVLAFDYRHFGESGGSPRQIVSVPAQLADWGAAIDYAKTLPEVSPERLALWGFSLGGGHVVAVAAGRRDVAAAIAQAPTLDGRAAALNASRHAAPTATLRLLARALRDVVGGSFDREPILVRTAGRRGDLAMLTTPDALDARPALDPSGAHTSWDDRVAARFALASGRYRPGRKAARVRCPLLVVANDDDSSALAWPAVRAAARAPQGQLLCRPGGHYESFLGDFDYTVEAEVEFLRRSLLAESHC